MSFSAPLRVPVELKGSSELRWFKLANEIWDRGLGLSAPVPEELDGPIELAFHLPGDPKPIRCRGRAEEVVVTYGEEERAERRELRFLDLDDASRARIEAYVQERLGLPE